MLFEERKSLPTSTVCYRLFIYAAHVRYVWCLPKSWVWFSRDAPTICMRIQHIQEDVCG